MSNANREKQRGKRSDTARPRASEGAIHAPNPVLRETFPVLVLDVRDGVSCPPRVGHHEMHWHEDVQFLVVSRGVAVIDTPERHLVCEAGTAVLFCPNALHRVVSAEGSLYTSFVFPPKTLELLPASDLALQCVAPYAESEAQRVVHFDGSQPWHTEVLDALFEVRKLLLAPEVTHPMQYRAVAQLRVAWSCHVAHASAARLPKRALLLSARLRALIAYMEEHCADDIAVSDVARARAVSEAECSRCFKEVLQTTPHAYLVSLRIARAARLMQTTDLTLTDVAAQAGFNSPSHLSHAFKKAVGTTPRAWREAQGKNAAGQ